MDIKKIFICLFLIFAIASLSYVSANEIADSGNFTELNQEITNGNDVIEITKNYTHLSGEKNISIKKSVIITGQKQIIDFNDESSFQINDDINVAFINLTFKNVNQPILKLSKTSNSNVTFTDCEMLKADTKNFIIIKNNVPLKKSTSVKVSSKIKKLAKSIVGKSKGIKAAKKLAKWVNKRIKHETKKGFYQSPTKTLKRKRGNCCCKSELFLQMCHAIGLAKKHKLCFVHVGFTKFKYRHFFTLIDNVCVDVDNGFKDPWGHGGFKNRNVYAVTKYPTLPLKKKY